MSKCDEDTILLAQKLNDKLKIDHLNWHKLKGKKINRSAELISAALCQLLISENDKDALNYLEESGLKASMLTTLVQVKTINIHLFKAN